jgi:hypothetical protein
MGLPDIHTALDWRGRTVVDRDGEKIGTLKEIYLDEQERPGWGSVHTALFGLRQTLVPLSEASPEGDLLQVPYDREHVKSAPNVDPDVQIDPDEEQRLFRHYDLEGDAPSREPAGPGDAPAEGASAAAVSSGRHDEMQRDDPGRAPAEGDAPRAERPDEHFTRAEPGTGEPARGEPAAGEPARGEPAAGEPARGEPAAGEPARAEPGTGEPARGEPAAGEPARGEPAAGEPARAEPAAGEPARAEPAAGEPARAEPAAGEPARGEPAAGEPARGEPAAGEPTSAGHEPRGDETGGAEMIRSEEEVHIGKRVRERGRARLKKYVVTDYVETKVPVQREEVRIEHDPPEEPEPGR